MTEDDAKTEDAPFWSDNFDMDLPKIFPDARRLLGDLGDIRLVTSGHADSNGRLNHPNVWNGDTTMLSFFGFAEPPLRRAGPFYKPPLYSTSGGEVFCSGWEAFRDAWPHGYLIQIEGYPIWDTHALWPQFEAIMWDVRGWDNESDRKRGAAKAIAAKRRVMKSYTWAVREFGRLVNARTPARPPSPAHGE